MGMPISFILCMVLSLPLVADPYQLFEEKGRIGLKDQQGKVLLPASFEALGWSDGSFSMAGEVTGFKLNNRWGLIHLSKKKLTEASYLELHYPGGNRVVARKQINPASQKSGCLDLTGEVKVPFDYDHLEIQGLRARVLIRDQQTYRAGLIDLDNKIIIPLKYRSIRPLGTLRYAVENNDYKTALFTEEGKAITDFSIDSISPFRNNFAIYHSGLRKGILSRDGELLTQAIYRKVTLTREGVAAALPSVWSVVDSKNQVLQSIDGDHLRNTPTGYIVTDTGRESLLSPDFTTLLPFWFQQLVPISDRLILARHRQQWGLYSLTQKWVIPAQFDSMVIEGDLIRAWKKSGSKNHATLFDTLGTAKNTKAYERMEAPAHHAFRVRYNNYWGLMDRTGKEFVHCVYDSILDMLHHQIYVKYKGHYGIIDRQEHWLVKPQPFPLQLINADVYLRHEKSMKYLMAWKGTIIYFTDNPVQPGDRTFLETLPDGVRKEIGYDGRLVKRDEDGQRIRDVHYSEGLSVFQNDGKFGFKDSRGRIRIANRYDHARPFQEGLAAIKILNRWGFIDSQEKIMVQPAYDGVFDYVNGLARVIRNNRHGLIDRGGKVILSLQYDSILPTPQGRYWIFEKNKMGLVSSTGRLLLEPSYEFLEEMTTGNLRAKRNGTWGILTPEGLIILPLVYDQVYPTPQAGTFLVWKKNDERWLSLSN